MADFPNSIYSPRTMTNRPGVEYDEDKTKVIYAEDFNFDRAEIVAIENYIGVKGASLIADRSAKITPVDADMFALMDSAASNVLKKFSWANLKAKIKAYLDAYYSTPDGWTNADEVWTYDSADDPVFTFTVPGDKTSKYSAGMRLRLSQNTGGTKYFIILKLVYSSPNTTFTVYGGTDYNLENEAISSPAFSACKAPVGFPLDPSKWTVRVTDNQNRTQSNPSTGVWYNLGGTNSQINIPIGCWDVYYQVVVRAYESDAVAGIEVYVTLSTAGDSESDSKWTSRMEIMTDSTPKVIGGSVFRKDFMNLAAKDTFYLNAKTSVAANSLSFVNADAGDMVIQAVCAYL